MSAPLASTAPRGRDEPARASPAGRLMRWAAAMVLGGLLCQAGAAMAGDRVVRSFPTGSGPADVGMSISDLTADREEEGPQALAAGDDGKLFVLDQVNRRIVGFDPDRPAAPAQTFDLPAGVEASDLVVGKSDFYVWDGGVHALQAMGPADAPTRSLAATRSADPVDEGTETAFAQMGSVTNDVDTQGTRSVRANPRNDLSRQVVNTHGRGRVTVDVKLTDRGAGAVLIAKGGTPTPLAATLHLRVHDRLGTVAFLDADQSGRMYVLAENIPLSIQDAAFVFVARYSPTGALEGVYEVPLSSTTVSRRSVTVSAQGDVYFLKTQKHSVDIVGLGFRATPDEKVIQVARYTPNVAAFAWSNVKNINIAVGPLTRQSVIQAALAYEGVQWTVTAQSYGTGEDPCSGFAGRVRTPMYMLGKRGQTVRGIPYCWGCQGTIGQFMAKVQRGTLAGNVCTKDGVRNDVAGVDCSSFVSAAWGLSTHFSTAVIPAISTQLTNPWDLLPGDALDKPGSHVVLFMGFTPNREAQVMEASPGACQGRVCRNTYPLSWLLSRGFIPVRYRALTEARS